MSGIVVGVDGSAESHAALRWAVEEARFRATSVEAVYVYEHTPSWLAYGYAEGIPVYSPEPPADPATQQEAARGRAQRLLDEAVASLGRVDDVPISTVAIEDRRPARALVEHSKRADMLVVGSRGRGGFAELLLGSVSHQCANHAACPVVIVSQRSAETD